MGRPLNKKYFQGGSGYTIGCFYHDGTSLEPSVIVRQRSNRIYEVVGTGGTDVGGDYTTLTFADVGSADTITRNGTLPDFSTTFSAGDFIRVEGSTSNDGIYEVASATAAEITLTASAELAAEGPVASTVELIEASATVRAKLVETAAAEGEMHIVVTPDSTAATKAKNINAHTVKCFDGNQYAWNPTEVGDYRGMDGAAGPRWEEATIGPAEI